MKTKLFRFLPLVMGAVMALSSCGDDDSDDPVSNPLTPKPTVSTTVNKTSGSSFSVVQGTSIEIALTATKTTSGKDLDKIRLEQNGANKTASGTSFVLSSVDNDYDFTTNGDISIERQDDETMVISGTFTDITANVGITTYTFTVTDKDGQSTSSAFDIEVTAPTTPFTSTNTGTIYHIGGALEGSWNLVDDAAVSGTMAPTTADISNTDMAGAVFTGAFEVGNLKAGTDFVIAASTFDYDNATKTSAQAAYDAGTPVTVASSPSVGAVYIYDLNGSISVVKILTLDPADNTCSCGNTGKMTFEYKK